MSERDPDGSGQDLDEQDLDEQDLDEQGPRRVLNVLLYAVTLVVACAVVALGVSIWQGRDRAEASTAAPAAYDDVLAAATAEATAFINIRYDRAQESIDAVAAGATGDFAQQYGKSTKGVRQVLRQNRSVMEGSVLWAGVVDADEDSATVIVATDGTVSNASTKGRSVARAFRLRLEMQLVDGAWLTSDLQFVG